MNQPAIHWSGSVEEERLDGLIGGDLLELHADDDPVALPLVE